MTNERQYFLGIDGGGTKCRATVFDEDGQICGSGLAGMANIARNFDVAVESILHASTQAVNQAGLQQHELSSLIAGAGLAGAGVKSAIGQLKAWQHPFKSFSFTTDLQTACLGAHNGQDGAVLISGTGSCAAKYVNNRFSHLGGHGFLLGDKGSGAWLGKVAIQRTLEQLDGIGQAGDFAHQVLQSLKVTDSFSLVNKMNNAPSSDFATLAPTIVALAKENCSEALDIVQQGATYLTQLCRQVLAEDDLALSLIGGLASPLSPWLGDDIQARLRVAANSPEWGAVLFAKSQC